MDGGIDFRNYTYAQFGRAVLQQLGQRAWQTFDAGGMIDHPPSLLREGRLFGRQASEQFLCRIQRNSPRF